MKLAGQTIGFLTQIRKQNPAVQLSSGFQTCVDREAFQFFQPKNSTFYLSRSDDSSGERECLPTLFWKQLKYSLKLTLIDGRPILIHNGLDWLKPMIGSIRGCHAHLTSASLICVCLQPQFVNKLITCKQSECLHRGRVTPGRGCGCKPMVYSLHGTMIMAISCERLHTCSSQLHGVQLQRHDIITQIHYTVLWWLCANTWYNS